MKPIPYSRQNISEDDISAVTRALKQDFVTQGPQLEALEAKLCEITGAQFAVACSNGTTALHLAVRALELPADSLGITSPISFAASANAFHYEKIPVAFADTRPTTGLIDPEALYTLLKEKQPSSGAIIPVSLQGRVPDLSKIHTYAQRHNLYTIEDAAQSIGATYSADGKTYQSGSCAHTDMATFSFHPVKHVCACEGGAVMTNNPVLAKKLKLLRSHCVVRTGEDPECPWLYDQLDLGFNYRLSEPQAALALSQLHSLAYNNKLRTQIAAKYYDALSQPPFSNHITLIDPSPGHSYHLFVIHFESASIRNKAHIFLKEHGFITQVHHRPIYQFSYYNNQNIEPLPGAEAYYDGCLSIPLYPSLEEHDQDRFIATLALFCNQLIPQKTS